jgi:hypothetical protein
VPGSTRPNANDRPRNPTVRSAAALALLLIAAALAGPPAGAGELRVTLTVPMPEVVDMTGISKVLVTRFVIDQEVPDFDLNREMVNGLRRELSTRTNLEILDIEPPPLPEQPLGDLIANTGFWQRLASRYGADMVIAGRAAFLVADRSGFVQVDEISPVTGQRVRRSRFVDREAFTLDMNLFFLRGSTGTLLYEDQFSADETYIGLMNDELSGVHTLFERLEDDIVGIIVPRPRTVQRILFTD